MRKAKGKRPERRRLPLTCCSRVLAPDGPNHHVCACSQMVAGVACIENAHVLGFSGAC